MELGRMMTASEKIIDEVTAWPGVSAQPGRFGATAFVLEDGAELGHVHADMVVDIPCTRGECTEWIEAGMAEAHRYTEGFGVSVFLNNDADVENALALLRQRYDMLLDR